MQIQVLGTGCAKCKSLFELTKKAVAEMGLTAEVKYVTDLSKILEMGVMSTPILAVDEQPVLVGTTESLERIKELLVSADNTECDGSEGCCKSSSGCKCSGGCC